MIADPAARPTYDYSSDQIAGEILLGQLSDVSLAYGAGVRAGYNNYDLYVFNGDQNLIRQVNEIVPFASWAVYLDLQVLLSWPFLGFGNWPFSPVFFMYSYEETFDGANNIKVPDVNGGEDIDLELKTRTQTLTLEIMF